MRQRATQSAAASSESAPVAPAPAPGGAVVLSSTLYEIPWQLKKKPFREFPIVIRRGWVNSSRPVNSSVLCKFRCLKYSRLWQTCRLRGFTFTFSVWIIVQFLYQDDHVWYYKNWTIIHTINVKVNPRRRHVCRNLLETLNKSNFCSVVSTNSSWTVHEHVQISGRNFHKTWTSWIFFTSS